MTNQDKTTPGEWVLNLVVIGITLVTLILVAAPAVWLWRWALGLL